MSTTTLSTMEVAYVAHHPTEARRPPDASSLVSLPSQECHQNTVSSAETSLPQLERCASRTTNSTEVDSGYASISASLVTQHTFPTPLYTSTDGVVLPERKLIPRRVTQLKVFDRTIPDSTQNRFKDLSELFNRRLYDFLKNGAKAGIGDVSIKLKILGESEATARPWVVIQCRKDVEKRVKKFFHQKDVLHEYQPPEKDAGFPSFKILVRALPPVRQAASLFTNIYARDLLEDESDPLTLCGMGIKTDHISGHRFATIGGLIKVHQGDSKVNIYGLTAGHVAHKDDDNKLVCQSEECVDGPDDKSDIEDDYYSDEDQCSDTDEEIQLNLEFDHDIQSMMNQTWEVSFDSEAEEIDPSSICRKVGHVSLTSQYTAGMLDGRNLDWALLEIEDARFCKPNLVFPEDASSDESKSKRVQVCLDTLEVQWTMLSEQSVMLMSGVSGVRYGTLSSVPSFLLLSPGTNFATTYDLKLSDGSVLRMGDSGSWVCNRNSFDIYGHVVSSDAFGESHVIPLSATFEDIKIGLKAESVLLPTIHDVKDQARRHFANIDAANTLDPQIKQDHDLAKIKQPALTATGDTPSEDMVEASATEPKDGNLMVDTPSILHDGESKANSTVGVEERRLHINNPEQEQYVGQITEVTFYQNTSPEQVPKSIRKDSQNAPATPMSSRLPLISDTSQYLGPKISSMNNDTKLMTLEQLANLVEHSRYQSQQLARVSDELTRLLISTDLYARLSRHAETTHRKLVDCYRHEDKNKFSMLYQRLFDLKKLCDEDQQGPVPSTSSANNSSDTQDSSFLEIMPARLRHSVLRFISRVRNDPEFLARRIASLTTAEVQIMTERHRRLDLNESILQQRTRDTPRDNINTSQVNELAYSLDQLDPLTTLIHTCFHADGLHSDDYVRRIKMWAAVCAKLITNQTRNGDMFLCGVLNIWTSSHDWRGRSSLENYLMQVYSDGAFLLKPQSDVQSRRTRSNRLPPDFKERSLVENFYTNAVEELFCIMGNRDAAVIPEGLIELGGAIVQQLDTKRQLSTKRFLVASWLSSVFLLEALTYPECHGMMLTSHITEHGRRIILHEIALRAHRLVVDTLWKPRSMSSTSIENEKPLASPSIINHINSILSLFDTLPDSRTVSPNPSRSTENLEQQSQFLIISPMEVVSVVKSLFPRSQRLSASVATLGIHAPPTYDTSSVIGTSRASSVAASVFSHSDYSTHTDASSVTQSRAPLLSDLEMDNIHLPSFAQDSFEEHTESEESLLLEATAEICRLCDDSDSSTDRITLVKHWAIIPLSSDGKILHTRNSESDNHADESDESCSSDSDDSAPGLDSSQTYHQLKNAVFKLLGSHAVGPAMQSGSRLRSKSFAIPAHGYLESTKKTSGTVKPPEREFSSPESYSTLLKYSKLGTNSNPSDLPSMLTTAQRQCMAQSAFADAHQYWTALNVLKGITSESLTRDYYAALLNIFAREPRASIRRMSTAIKASLSALGDALQRQDKYRMAFETTLSQQTAFRFKMWYTTDVRNSAAYEAARNMVVALMEPPKKPAVVNQRKFSGATQDLLGLDRTHIDLFSTYRTYCGWNKLSDEQSSLTSNWLLQNQIENICLGEEEMPRYCELVHSCVKKLVGDTALDSPIIWTSILFQRESSMAKVPEVEPRTTYGARESKLSEPFFGLRSSLDFLGGQESNSTRLDKSHHVRPDHSKKPKWHPGAKQRFLIDLERSLTSLLLSDFSAMSGGFSAIDGWFSSEIGREFVEITISNAQQPQKQTKSFEGQATVGTVPATEEAKTKRREEPVEEEGSQSKKIGTLSDSPVGPAWLRNLSSSGEARSQHDFTRYLDEGEFPWHTVFQKLLKQFSSHPNPFSKLEILDDLAAAITTFLKSTKQNKTKSRTSKTSKETNMKPPSSPEVIKVFKALISDPDTRPKTLFQDLQLISAFIPARLLDKTDYGGTFWQLSSATLELKQDVYRTMTEVATEVIQHHGNKGNVKGLYGSTTAMEPVEPSKYTLEDAGRFLVIAAKTGEPMAQRELALFYLIYPESVERAVAPFSKPGEIFKGFPEDGDNKGKGKEKEKRSTELVLARHWMALAAAGGDELARIFLRNADADDYI